MRYIIVICLWLVFMSNSLWAKSYVIGYEIYDDSNDSSVFEVKRELFDWYDSLVSRVDDVYIGELLENELDTFDYNNVSIEYDNHVITLVIGDGFGYYIKGELVEETCVVKPRGTSFIQELFNK